jgi:hypothetical protein
MVKGHPVRLLFIGDYPSEIKEFFALISPNNTPKAFRFLIANFSMTQLSIPLGKKFKLVLDSKSPSGELVPINQCTLPDNTLIAGTIRVSNGISSLAESVKIKGEIQPPSENTSAISESTASEITARKNVAKQRLNQKELQAKIRSELQRTGGVFKGEIVLWDLHSFEDRGKLIERYFNRSEKLIEQNKKDTELIEADWQRRYDTMVGAMNTHNSHLQNKIDDLQQQLILQKIVYGERISDLVSESVVDSMTTQYVSNDELRKEVLSLKKSLEEARKGIKQNDQKGVE